MAYLQELAAEQLAEALSGAAERQIPVTLTIRSGQTWMNLRSRLLGVSDEHVLFEPPVAWQGQAPHEFAPGESVGVSFKHKHHKHVFAATVVGQDQWTHADGQVLPALRVTRPTRMERVQRRAFTRVDVPPNRIVRVAFWLGGRHAEPAGTSPERPVWAGRVTDLSAGGFRAAVAYDVTLALDVGETVGLRLSFGAAESSVYADAVFRHVEDQQGQALMGFQFIALLQSDEGRAAIELIGDKVRQYQHADVRPHIRSGR